MPRCPVCIDAMEINLCYDEFFVGDLAWHEAASNYQAFLQKYQDKKIVFLELGVGMNTPICINMGDAWAPPEIDVNAVYLNENISKVLEYLFFEQ